MNTKDFELAIKQVYDNLTKEQFFNLCKATHTKFLQQSDENLNIKFKNQYDEMAYNIFNLVLKSKRISFQQFKVVSAFSKIKWISAEKQEYKQF